MFHQCQLGKKLNNIPTCPLTNPISIYNVDGTTNKAGMIMEVIDVDMTPAASPRTSKGPQKHAMVFRSKHVYSDQNMSIPIKTCLFRAQTHQKPSISIIDTSKTLT
jgi:hypothetical protein